MPLRTFSSLMLSNGLIYPLPPGRKYRYMDANLTQRRRGLEEKVPDIRKTLNMVEYLNERRVSEFVHIVDDFMLLPSVFTIVERHGEDG